MLTSSRFLVPHWYPNGLLLGTSVTISAISLYTLKHCNDSWTVAAQVAFRRVYRSSRDVVSTWRPTFIEKIANGWRDIYQSLLIKNSSTRWSGIFQRNKQSLIGTVTVCPDVPRKSKIYNMYQCVRLISVRHIYTIYPFCSVLSTIPCYPFIGTQ